jgi:DNA (cytosine-5)-methyltransferase 1
VAQQKDGSDTANQSCDGREDASAWANFDLIPCTDGKTRRIEPGLAPLADGIPARVVRLRGYGNAIVPQVAAEFVQAYREAVIDL